jgi:hypothetical protein
VDRSALKQSADALKKALEIAGNTTPERMLKSHAASMSKPVRTTRSTHAQETLTVIVPISANRRGATRTRLQHLWLKPTARRRVLALGPFTRPTCATSSCAWTIVKMKKRLKKAPTGTHRQHDVPAAGLNASTPPSAPTSTTSRSFAGTC